MQVGANATLGAEVKVYPFKTIEDGAVVNSSIVWESRGASTLFGRDGVDGLANVDITPELAVKLALAYGTSLRKGETVVTSRDSSRSARMLKRALMAGLNSAGINVLDLEVASTPVTRFLVKSPKAIGGLTVRLRNDDPSSVAIHFYDTTGMDIAEDAQRKIERLFQREDYRRALPEEMGDISFPHRALEDYTVELAHIVEPGQIAERQFKLVIDYGYGTASLAMASVLTKLRADVLAVNPYASTIGAPVVRPGGLDQAGGRPGAGVGRAGGCRLRPRRRAAHPHRRRGRGADAHRGHAVLRGARCATTCSVTASPSRST